MIGSINSASLVGSLEGHSVLGDVRVGSIVVGNSNIYVKTTEEWSREIVHIPKKGDICVYSDRDYKIVYGEKVYIPGVKIGDGSAYVVDLPFIDDKQAEALYAHINDDLIHITEEERQSWNSKVSCDISGKELIFKT